MSLAGVGTLLGGLSGFFGGKSPPSQGRQIYSQVQGAVNAGKQFNLHPLAVLGNTSSYVPASNNNVQDGLQSMGTALQSLASQKDQTAANAKANELMDAQIAEARSRTLLNLGNAQRATMGPMGPTGATGGLEVVRGGSGATYSPHVTHTRSADRPMNVEPERDFPITSRVGVGGSSLWGLNPEAFEVGLSELIAGGAIYGPQLLYDNLKGIKLPKTEPTRKRSSKSSQMPEYGPSRYK